MSTPCSPPTIPLPAQTMPDLRFPPFPESRSTLGVRGGPLVALVALLAGVVALCAIAVIGAGWPDWWVPTGLALVVVAAYCLLWGLLVRPVRRFAAAMARMAAEDRDGVGRGRQQQPAATDQERDLGDGSSRARRRSVAVAAIGRGRHLLRHAIVLPD